MTHCEWSKHAGLTQTLRDSISRVQETPQLRTLEIRLNLQTLNGLHDLLGDCFAIPVIRQTSHLDEQGDVKEELLTSDPRERHGSLSSLIRV